MSLRFAVLGLLTVAPASGYELAKHFETTLAGIWFARRNQLYAELNHLTEEGLAEVAEEGARGKRVYAATDAGRAALHGWLTEDEPDPRVHDEIALRDFLLPQLPPGDAAAILRREVDELTGALADADRLLEAMYARAPDEMRTLATERRRLFLQARLTWASGVLRRLERPGESTA